MYEFILNIPTLTGLKSNEDEACIDISLTIIKY